MSLMPCLALIVRVGTISTLWSASNSNVNLPHDKNRTVMKQETVTTRWNKIKVYKCISQKYILLSGHCLSDSSSYVGMSFFCTFIRDFMKKYINWLYRYQSYTNTRLKSKGTSQTYGVGKVCRYLYSTVWTSGIFVQFLYCRSTWYLFFYRIYMYVEHICENVFPYLFFNNNRKFNVFYFDTKTHGCVNNSNRIHFLKFLQHLFNFLVFSRLDDVHRMGTSFTYLKKCFPSLATCKL